MNRDYIINLYEVYKELLTEKQREYFEFYYYEDLSFSEIKENVGVSRTIINRTVNLVNEKLLEYERILRLYEIKYKLREINAIEKDMTIKKVLEDLI